MIRIPPENRWKQANSSDLFGSVYATKNINFDEEGYAKLSSRMVSIMSEDTDDTHELPLFIGRKDEDDFHVITNNDAFDTTVSTTSITSTEDADTGVPTTFSANAGAVFWQNRLYATDTDDLFWKNLSTGTWTDIGNLTSGVPHPLEVFRNKNLLAVGDANTVKLYDTSHSLSITLTIPSDFVVIGLAYSNNKLGIITKLSSSIAGQNQDAFFFVWDGATTSANGGFPIGSDMAAGLVAYMGSWIVVNRAGNVIYFNGGGFNELASFPFYFRDVTWGDFSNRVGKGVNMQVEGDVVYFNLNLSMDQYGIKAEDYLPYCPSGVWCFDPKVGLYHRYSPSLSPLSIISVLQAGINTTTNVFTANTGTIPETGNPILYSNNQGTEITGLTTRKIYFVIKVSSSTFKLATSKTNALAGIAIDITSTGAATNYFAPLEVRDFGASHVNDASGIALMGVQSPVYDHLFVGADLVDYDTNVNIAHQCVSVQGFENRGYIITPKIIASGTEDTYQTLVVPFRPLEDTDSIVVKIKDVERQGLPVSTSQGGAVCTWTGTRQFYVTADLSDVKTHFDASHEIECEILAGAGAGASVKVSDIDEEDGVYSITLDEDVPGAASGRFCDAMFDNWRHVKTITSDDNEKGYADVPLSSQSKWNIYKIELRGVNVALEPLHLKTTNLK